MGVMAWASREARVQERVDLTPFFTLPASFPVLTEGYHLRAGAGTKVKPFPDIIPFNLQVSEEGVYCYCLLVTSEVCGSERGACFP